MKFACPICAKKYNLADETLAARESVRLKCRQCGEQITVKESGELKIAPLSPETHLEGASEAPPPLPSHVPPSVAEAKDGEPGLQAAPTGEWPRLVVTEGAGLTPPLPPLTRGATPPPPPSSRASSPPASLAVSSKSPAGAAPNPSVAVEEFRSALVRASMRVKLASAQVSTAAVAKLEAWGLDEPQRVWAIFGTGLVVGLLLAALF